MTHHTPKMPSAVKNSELCRFAKALAKLIEKQQFEKITPQVHPSTQHNCSLVIYFHSYINRLQKASIDLAFRTIQPYEQTRTYGRMPAGANYIMRCMTDLPLTPNHTYPRLSQYDFGHKHPALYFIYLNNPELFELFVKNIIAYVGDIVEYLRFNPTEST